MADQPARSLSPKLDSGDTEAEPGSPTGSGIETKTDDTSPRPQSSPRNSSSFYSQHKRPADRDASRDDAAAVSGSTSGLTQPDYKRQKSPSTRVPDDHPSPPAFAAPPRYPGIETQLEARPVSMTQLVNEIKNIYTGLVMVESKCIEIDDAQGASGNTFNNLNDEQWQALVALHRTLLHEHHDFMITSQHPSASPSLRRLAQKYTMPTRMWRHGIHRFLELLRHHLPASGEHMTAFIYLAYSMTAMLYEQVPAFEDAWAECLGDLSRYRYAIEDDDQHVRDTWKGVSRRWYTVASNRAPTIGRLYHHLAILAWPNIITQMHFYAKSLCVPIPFASTRESILTLFDPILNGVPTRGVPPIDTHFATAHAILFTKAPCLGRLDSATSEYLQALPGHITRMAKNWIETGAQTAVVNCCALLQYGDKHNALLKLLQKSGSAVDTGDNDSDDCDSNIDDNEGGDVHLKPGSSNDADIDGAITDAPSDKQPPVGYDALARSQKFTVDTDNVVLSMNGKPSCNGYIHVRLVWMLSMARLPGARAFLENAFPWRRLTNALNLMMASCSSYEHIERETFPQLVKEERSSSPKDEPKTQSEDSYRDKTGVATSILAFPPPPSRKSKPLPEDWALRGLSWAEDMFPHAWFDIVDIMDDDDRFMESEPMAELRRERILWLAWKLARYEKWLVYDATKHEFSVANPFINVGDRERGWGANAIIDDLDEAGNELVEN
ncbi:hypothetical protein SPI_07898 [Niveomyces insectorum RCEF 264]|uniref:DNA/RNA-binding domain-containing protein n=1 Tax=Niveomyces insectorum RCEF 264 TaxID=1081102 RepID=A0A167P4Q3_9HYPO|nr:hypothetical protein SPI_07898 [Niveomyces insectorum RCEF 264]